MIIKKWQRYISLHDVNEILVFRVVEPDLVVCEGHNHTLSSILLGPLDIKFGYVDNIGGHLNCEILLAFLVKRVQGIVHTCYHKLFLEQNEANRLALNTEYDIREDLTILEDIYFAISTGYVDSVINIKLANALHEAWH